MKFSERYGYVKPANVLKRGCLDAECATALCNCFDFLYKWLNQFDLSRSMGYDSTYSNMEEKIWCFFMNQRRDTFYEYSGHKIVATEYLQSESIEWFKKFDMIEFAITHLRHVHKQYSEHSSIINSFIKLLNDTFKRLSYAYRVVDDQIVEITDDEEIETIEKAIDQSTTIKTHLSAALKHLSKMPVPDYRNSIKESISAVEVVCREITGELTLGPALKQLERKGVALPSSLKAAFEKLYVYTNDQQTGIRHALMDDSYSPQYPEAKFMLVACSAFVNYIQEKRIS